MPKKAPSSRKQYRRYWIQDCPNLIPSSGTGCDDGDGNAASLVLLLTETSLRDDHHQNCTTKKQISGDKNTTTSSVDIVAEQLPSVDDGTPQQHQRGSILLQQNTVKTAKIQRNGDTATPTVPNTHNTDTYQLETESSARPEVTALLSPMTSFPTVYIQRVRNKNLYNNNCTTTTTTKKKKRPATSQYLDLPNGDCGDGILNPYSTTIVPNKYWAQRKRYFYHFDEGIRLDAEGWFSVTPEMIAHHIARRMVASSSSSSSSLWSSHHQHPPCSGAATNCIVLDAFVGMGGNAIAFAQQEQVACVVCVDTNIEKLQLAANNCSIYKIPKNKVVFILGNACDVLQSYTNGIRNTATIAQACAIGEITTISTDEPTDITENVENGTMNETSSTTAILDNNNDETNHDQSYGYTFGTYDRLPDHLDMIFLSPPWGGTDYETIGPRHYDLNCIQLLPSHPSPETTHKNTSDDSDSIGTANDCNKEHSLIVNGEELLRMAIAALPPEQLNIGYFLPRNLNGMMFGLSCYSCGIRGFVELEQNILNSKLKTITAYIQSYMSQSAT
jgi:16S rRNA G966 N2-methylase RsmD